MATKPLQTIKFPGIADTFTFLQKDEVVRYDAAQSLTSAQKAQARENIGAGSGFEIDGSMSASSENPVQNKVIKAYVDSGYGSAAYGKAPAITADASGSVVTIEDGGAAPVKSMIINITPVQSGSGDPSPSNIRPITGWTGTGIYDDPKHVGIINWNQLAPYTIGDWSAYRASGTITGRKIKITTTSSTSLKYFQTGSTVTGHTYYIACTFLAEESNYGMVLGLYQQTSNLYFDRISISSSGGTARYSKIISNVDASDYMLSVVFGTGASSGVYATLEDVLWCDLTAMFGAGNEPTTVEQFEAMFPLTTYAYNAGEETCVSAVNGEPYWQYSVSWQTESGTVYGGTLDLSTKKLTITDGYIEQYNGESLPSTWISDRDVYAAGTTPTTGAQVVYKLATPTEETLDDVPIVYTIKGNNNIWADCGSISLTYAVDTKSYIDAKVSALMAVLSEV